VEDKISVNWKKFIDALSLGMNDFEISSSLGMEIRNVQRVREHLDLIGGTIGDSLEIEARRKVARERLGLE